MRIIQTLSEIPDQARLRAKAICSPLDMKFYARVQIEGTKTEIWLPARHFQHAERIAEAINEELPQLKRVEAGLFEIMPEDVIGDPNGPGGGERRPGGGEDTAEES